VFQDTASVLFGVEGLQVVDAETGAGGTLEVWAVTDHPAAGVCPDCGVRASRVHEHVLTRPRDVCRGLDQVRACWVKRRWKCGNGQCARKTFTESVPQAPPRCRLTERLREQAAAEIAERGITPAEAARHAGISWPAAHDAFAARADPVLEQALAPVAHLGIDEHRRGRPRWTRDEDTGEYVLLADRWHTCFSGLSGGQGLLGQVEGRAADDAAYWLAQAAPAWRDAIRVVATEQACRHPSPLGQIDDSARLSSLGVRAQAVPRMFFMAHDPQYVIVLFLADTRVAVPGKRFYSWWGEAMRKLARVDRRRKAAGLGIRRESGEYAPIPVLGRILESDEKQLVIGRQGAGKTTLRKALAHLAGDRYIPSEVTPDDLSLRELRELELGGLNAEETMFLFWRYVVAIRVARYAVVHAEEHEHRPGSAGVLRKFLVDSGELGEPGFKERIFRYAAGLKSLSLSVGITGVTASADFGEQPGAPEGTRTRRMLLTIEDQIMRVLADLQCPASHPRLLLLADEIHNVWSGDAQSNAIVAGLLRAARYAQEEYAMVRCLVFLPDAIYDSLQFPDRNAYRGSEIRLTWTAGSLRDLAEAQSKTAAGRPWKTLPAAKIYGQPAIDYLISRTLHRPRDLDQLVKLCRDAADRQGRAEVSADDITEAEAEFSRWKLQDLEAEYKTRYPFLPQLLYLFHDTAYAYPRNKADSLLAAHTPDLLEWFPEAASVVRWPGLLQVLYEISFLGVRRGPQIVYSYDSTQMIEPADREFHVHPCFRPALRLTAGAGLEPYRPASPASQPVIRSSIGLWGTPESGKTTFLAALPAAAAQAHTEPMIYGTNDTSTRFLADRSKNLTVDRRFPPFSSRPELLSLAVTRAALPVRRLSRRPAATALEFAVSILDVPGSRFSFAELYDRPHGLIDERAETPEDIAEYLARCDGLIYCFDPIQEHSKGDAYAHFEGTLLKVAQLRLQDTHSTQHDTKLPHYLAVCATKFDALPVLETARTMNLLTVDQDDPHQMPRVADADAAEVFSSLCRQSRSGTAELIPAEISRYFHQDRVKYFITSATGFYIDPSTGRFDPGDPQNVLAGSGQPGEQMLRSPIHPINIIEPLLWIGEHTMSRNPE